MGNSAILVVFASVLSGIMIFLNIQKINTEANVIQSHLQDEVLARELAHNGLNLALAKMFSTGGVISREEINSVDGSIIIGNYKESGSKIRFSVLGEYGDAQYMINSEYSYASGFKCGAACGDGPRLDLTMNEEASIIGGGTDGYRAFNLSLEEYNRLQSQPGLSDLYDINQVIEDLNNELVSAWEGITDEVTEVNVLSDGQSLDDLLPDIDPNQDNPWLQEFYFTTLDKMELGPGSSDAYFAPALSTEDAFAGEFGSLNPESENFGKNYSFGTPEANAIVRVDGNMVVRDGSTLAGNGILIVEGDLLVEPAATMNWNGIVFLRPETKHSVTKLDGTVNITGSLVFYQEALPPGSHMDVTTNRDLTGNWFEAKGRETNQAGIPIAGPWFVHIHKWDQTWFSRPPISAAREIFLRRDGGPGEHEPYVRFNETLNDIASSGVEEIQLEFVNPGQSGMAVFNMTLNENGTLTTYQNPVSRGFGGSAKSKPFRPADLKDFGMLVRSVRFLQLMRDPDPEGSSWDGAVRVAHNKGRKSSFYIKVIDANTGRELMNTSVYQHIREDESEEYEQELEELKQDIIDGNFGLSIEMGPNATIRYDEQTASNAFRRTEFPAYTHETTFTRRCNSTERWKYNTSEMPREDNEAACDLRPLIN